jgi:hypothetical protein
LNHRLPPGIGWSTKKVIAYALPARPIRKGKEINYGSASSREPSSREPMNRALIWDRIERRLDYAFVTAHLQVLQATCPLADVDDGSMLFTTIHCERSSARCWTSTQLCVGNRNEYAIRDYAVLFVPGGVFYGASEM